jgi:LmbE family N-acetylglucosaminyl deacetylase
MAKTHALNRNRLTLLAGVVILLAATFAAPSADAILVDDPVGSILVVAPHPDDDVITTAGITYNRSDVTIAFMTNSDTDDVGPSVRQDEAVLAQAILGQPESKLIFLGYPDSGLQAVWNTPSGSYNSNGYTETFAEHGLGMTDWHDWRMGGGEQHAAYNKPNMVADMVALIEYVRPAHIFTTSEFDSHTDHSTTFKVIDEALDTVTASDPTYGAVLHETIVWHPDSGLWSTWPQGRNASTEIVHDTTLGASPSIETASGGKLVWSEREQFYIPEEWVGVGDANPKAQAIDAHAGQDGLDGFIGRFVHRDEIFWADYLNYPVLSISDTTTTEGGNATFTISRTGATNVEVAVTATTSDGSATAPSDYTAKSQQVTLGVGEAAVSFSVATTNDTAGESSETFTVALSSPTVGTTLGDASGTGTITDDDTGLVVAVDGLSAGSTGVAAEFTASVVSGGTGTVTHAWTVTRGAATVAAGTGATFSFTPTADGVHTVTVVPSDDGGAHAPVTASLNVLADIAGSTFVQDIIWLADEGITAGCNPPTNTNFCPDNNVTRGQMAAFLVRFLGLTDDGGGNKFVDDNGSVFEADIAKLAAAGITAGCNPPANTNFCPESNVTRGQMAAFLRRASNLS